MDGQATHKMKVPIVCETDGCPNYGKTINWVTNIPEEDLDLFYEGYDESEPADYCQLCGEWGVAEDPVPE